MKNIVIKIEKIIEYLIYIFIFLLPFQTRYIFSYLHLGFSEFEYGKLSIYFGDVVFGIIVILFLIAKLNQIKNIRVNKQFLISFLFLLICSINYFFASDLQMYFYYLFRILECVAFLFFLQIIKIDFRKIFYFFIVSIIFHGILGIFQFINQNIVANKYLGIAQHLASVGGSSVLENASGRFLRIYGGFTHPNVFAGFITLAIVFLLILFFTNCNCNKYKRLVFFLTLGFLLEILFLTFSRSAVLAFFLCLVLLFIFETIRRECKKILGVLIFIFIIFSINIFIFKDLVYSRAIGADRLELKSINDRSLLSHQSKIILKNNWILGVGLGNYIPYVYNNINSDLNVWDYQPVHNVYLLILSELGILGLLCYVSMFIYAFFCKIKQRKYIFILPLVVILIINLFDHYFWTSFSGVLLSFLVLNLGEGA